jgi:lipopolysaccharide/colanic/teichoic acid biosynthesis glycosyltransferase
LHFRACVTDPPLESNYYTPAYRRPLLAPRTRVLTPAHEGGRRALNVLLAATALAVAAPLMVAIAALIKLTSRGPVLYTQLRVGLDRRRHRGSGDNWRRGDDCGGRPFRIYKFRTMRHNGDDGDAQVWASPDDPRVTRIGRVLRQFRLDELPQLVNVLLGDMNIVGPRPEQPQIFRQLRARIDGYHHRQRVRPGITGWAQVNHHYDKSLDDVRRKVGYDLEYVARPSVWRDVTILLRTIPVVMLRRGAW